MLRFDPFRDLDRMTEQVTRRSGSIMAFDAVRDEDQVIMYFDVPGVSADDLDVSVEKNEVTVTAERRWNDQGLHIVASERPQGTFTRRVMLSDALDTDRLEADLRDGVLTITVPVDESSKQRRVKVTAGGKASAVETTSRESGD